MAFGTFTILWVLSSFRTFSLHFRKEIPYPLKNNYHIVLFYYHILLHRIVFPSHSCRWQWESPKCLACHGCSHCIIIVTERKKSLCSYRDIFQLERIFWDDLFPESHLAQEETEAQGSLETRLRPHSDKARIVPSSVLLQSPHSFHYMTFLY